MPDHPGFAYWEVNDPNHPYRVGQVNLLWSDDGGASASADMTLPAAQPKAATVAERSIGIAQSTKLWFGLECATLPNGQVTCEALLAGKHVHWYPAHNETAPGPEQQIRLTAADLKGGGHKEAFGVHGPHFDLFSVTWLQNAGKVAFTLTVTHWAMTIDEFIEARKKNARDAEREPRDGWRPLVPDYSTPAPTPAPRPRPDG